MASSAPSLDLSAALGKFGLSQFRRGQREVIEHVIAGLDCLCVMPTGGGKSLCYQLPSLVRPGLTIVVSPLIALMKDQVDSLLKRGIRATLINSSLSPQEQNQRLEQVAAGRYSLVYVAPERLRNPRFLESIRATPIQLLAIDEAHCISEWGHDFRPDYQRLGRFREALGNVQTIALTATATPRVRADILDSLKLTGSRTFITGFARDNLYFGSLQCMSDRDKDKHLCKFLEGRKESGIIYVATRKRCEALVDHLAKEVKLSVGAYHAGLLPEQRKLIQEQFMAGELKAIVATNAFGMGIDKSDLRYVIHYNMPGTLEAYYQEAGRAGRDGLKSQCVLLYSAQDRYIQEFFIENANPSKALLETVYRFLCSCEEDPIELTAEEIREKIDQSASAEAVNASLQILSRTGVLERLEVAGGLAMFRLSSRLPTFVDLLPRDATVRRQVLRTVEKAIGDRRDEAVYIHPRWMMEQLEMDRDAMNRHLRELCKLEDFDYVPPFRGRAIHFLRRDVPFSALAIDHEALAVRKKADYEKLDQMVAYARTKSCRQKAILDYFGDTSATNCGICDRCQGKSGWPKLPKNPSVPSDLAAPSAAAPPPTLSTAAPSPPPPSPKHSEIPPAIPEVSPSERPRAETGVGKPAASVPSLPSLEAFSTEERRTAIQRIQTLLGAIERTHGYLSKTVLSQHFGGVASKAVTGLRLQRLPEFGLLKDWKKSHTTNLVDRMMESGVVEQSEIRAGKLTVAITNLGRTAMTSATEISNPLVAYVCQAIRAADGTRGTQPDEERPHSPPTAPTPPVAEKRAVPRGSTFQEVSDVSAPEELDVSVRPASLLPPAESTDAASVQVDQSLLTDWQWTLRLVRHGYRLGEVALIRGKAPEAILADLTVALQCEESVPIELLFDRRTILTIQELRIQGTKAASPPPALQVFSGLWPFVQQWLAQNP